MSHATILSLHGCKLSGQTSGHTRLIPHVVCVGMHGLTCSPPKVILFKVISNVHMSSELNNVYFTKNSDNVPTHTTTAKI